MGQQKVGMISPRVAAVLGLNELAGSPIFLGDTNTAHMMASHPNDFQKYGKEIQNILQSPDYVGVNQKDSSIEYVKEFLVDGDFVKVAVRVSSSGKHFARSLYVLGQNRVQNFIAKGTLKKP